MRSSNPVFAGNPYSTAVDETYGSARSSTMTVGGTVGKTFILLAILTGTAAWTWVQLATKSMDIMPLLMFSLLAGLPIVLVTTFFPKASPITGPLYAAAEGVFLGAISQIFNARYPGIAGQAVGVTIATTFTMLTIYWSGIIKVTDKLIMGITGATMALALFYVVVMLLRLFGVHTAGFLYQASPLGIGFSLFIVGLAAFNLLVDFEFIKRGADAYAPKYMEWYTAFGLMVTLVWLYMEVLRLLSKLRDR